MKNSSRKFIKLNLSHLFITALVVLCSFRVIAAGMVPETSMLFVNESDEGAGMNVKNSDLQAQLLYTTVTDLPDDKDTHLVVTQPVVRVEAGQIQHIRFILQIDKPLKVEHMKRVVFESIPQKKKGNNMVGFNIRQDLPVLIHPANLPEVQNAWTQLMWKKIGSTVTMTNPSPYVVRFQPSATLLPSHTNVKISKTYILPGQTISIDTGGPISDMHIQFSPVSRYGVKVDNYTSPLTTK